MSRQFTILKTPVAPKMASVSDVVHSKRPHVKTKRMQEFIQSQGEASSPTKKFKCPEEWCGKVFTSTPGLKYHLQKHRQQLQEFGCRKCYRVFKSANGLKYHREKSKCDDSDLHPLEAKFTSPVAYSHSRGHLPHPLDLTYNDTECANDDDRRDDKNRPGMDNLTKLAIIATSPQSPLMQRYKPPWDIKPSGGAVRSLNKMLHKWEDTGTTDSESDIHVPICDLPASDGSVFSDGCDPHVSSSSPLFITPEEEISSNWSHKWPTAVWQCFIKDTKVRFADSGSKEWHLVQTIAQKEELAQQASLNTPVINSYACNGLTIKNVINPDDGLEKVIHFSPNCAGQSDLTAVCEVDHPFFVKDKGWSSCSPCRTVTKYGIPCNDLSIGDTCLPPNHPDAASTEDIFRGLEEEFDFTPEDTSAVFALSSMKQRKDSDQSPKAGSGATSPVKPNRDESHVKAKRPMNAFMLFAQEFRVGYTKKFPKKDNRAISIILGEQWKSLSSEKRQHYEEKAKLLAEQQKRKHPDCWKRKK